MHLANNDWIVFEVNGHLKVGNCRGYNILLAVTWMPMTYINLDHQTKLVKVEIVLSNNEQYILWWDQFVKLVSCFTFKEGWFLKTYFSQQKSL